jgi:hypothetical protein
VVFVIAGHFLNYRYCTKNQCHSPHHKHWWYWKLISYDSGNIIPTKREISHF